MDAVFSLPYSEYEAIIQIQKHFKKNDGFSVFVPTSRQERGIDFIVLNSNNCKVLRFQVKGSRPFVSSKPDKGKREVFKYTFWFNNFFNRCEPNAADVYLLFGLYPMYDVGKNIKSKGQFWRSFVLAFTDSEMRDFLDRVRTKKENKRDRFFYISFNDVSRIVVTRGRPDHPDINDHLLSHKLPELLQRVR